VIPASQRRPGPWVDFHHGQIESATVLVLNKCDQVDDAQREQCRRFLRAINPVALIVETDFGEVPPDVWDRPGTMPQADFATEKRLRIEQEEQLDVAKGVYPDIDCRVVRVWRAFHPERLWTWFNEDHPGLLRVKGIIWLATRNLLVGGVSRTLWQNGCGADGLWWAALPEDQWPESVERKIDIQATWHEPYGDRRQELTLIGTRSSLDSVSEGLLTCLLTDEEVAAGPHEWVKWNDPFPEWSLGEEPA
jgi:G3E family GTPase